MQYIRWWQVHTGEEMAVEDSREGRKSLLAVFDLADREDLSNSEMSNSTL